LSLLLKGAVELYDFCNESILKLNADGQIETGNKECKEKIMPIEKWTNAFIIYISIYLQNHPDKVHEMLHYLLNIRECALRQGDTAWRTYDEQFRLRQVLSPQSWSQINNDLWWRCMQVRDAQTPMSNTRRYTCNDYNKGSCTWQNCRFSHNCSKCNGVHPEIQCNNFSPLTNFQS
jgi:hypothetical protein